jgi:branched-chain amino acid transport system substrate-binding protein
MSDAQRLSLLSILEKEHALSRRTFIKTLAGGMAVMSLPALLEACGLGSTPSASTSASARFDLGVLKTLTGPLVGSFAPTFVPLDIAIQEINKAGGILGRQINVVLQDDQGAAAAEPQASRNLIDAGAKFIIGPVGSSQCLASLEVTQQNQIIQFPEGTSPPVADPVKYPGSFYPGYTNVQEVRIIVAHVVAQASKIGVLYTNDAFGQTAGPASVALLKAAGVTPVVVESYDTSAVSLTPQLERLKAAGADGVVVSIDTAPPAAYLVTAMIDLDYMPFIGSTSPYFFNIHQLVPTSVQIPPSLIAKLTVPTYKSLTWLPGSPVASRQLEFLKKVAAHPDTGPLVFTVAQAPFYDDLYLLKTAIEAANSFDYAKVKSALESITNYQGMLGSMTFTSSNHLALADSALVAAVPDYSGPESLGYLPRRA